MKSVLDSFLEKHMHTHRETCLLLGVSWFRGDDRPAIEIGRIRKNSIC